MACTAAVVSPFFFASRFGPDNHKEHSGNLIFIQEGYAILSPRWGTGFVIGDTPHSTENPLD